MIKRKSEDRHEERTGMRGGNGTIQFEHIWEKETEMHSNTRMFTKMILNPGCSIGTHKHENEEEIFVILSGRAEADDNGTKVILEPGDSIITRSGESHSIACAGSQPLELLACILCY